MQIVFSNGRELVYHRAIANDHDFKNGITRPSIEVLLPMEQTSYEEISRLIGNAEIMKSFTLIGDEQPVYSVDEHGNMLYEGGQPIIEGYTIPQNDYVGYTIPGSIVTEDGMITFKMYRQSDVELEKDEALRTIDQLLMAMEG